MAATASTGSTVKLHYTLTLEDGTIFDSSREREPFEVKLGAGQVIQGFEQALMGMAEGESKQVTIASEQAYGPWREELVQEVARDQLPAELPLEIGRQLQASDPQGRTMLLTVIEMDDQSVKLDANHPLAGEDLTFDLEVLGVH
ncbi:peptidylprolyl isomerase [Geminicoccaceae bacterium 1502E]|nr:peptidylprolyl isomerase [Geminicoccaceae bacterium 1502E]